MGLRGGQYQEGRTGAGRQWGEAGLIYEASSDGTTWQGGHSRQTLGDKSPEVCERCKQWEVDTPAPPYQSETPRTGQDKAAILDGRRHQDFPGPGLAFPVSQPTPLILPHLPTPHHCSDHTSHRDPTSSLNPAQLGVLSQGKPPPEFSLNSSGSPSSLPPRQWLITALLKLSLPNLLHFAECVPHFLPLWGLSTHDAWQTPTQPLKSIS